MSERKGKVTFLGTPLTLTGETLNLGGRAPNAELLDSDLKAVSLDDYRSKVRVIVSVPSIDTPVCDLETRRFNKYAESLGTDVKVLVVSMDLPFAQKRWCGAAGVSNVVMLSDFNKKQFGNGFGMLIKENGLLARAVHVLDKDGIIKYAQVVPELTNEPDYEDVIKAVKELLAR